ncbi:MAG: tryptophan 2,3-dioxygenase [Phycisphaerae bacterium]|nr:MAG: tryptophan 2,3-dioxygenase [Phycisphaerae bacterium]
MSLNYSEYLKIDQLLDLQKVRSDPPEHDEMLFVIIHQVYELWFKQLIHEFELLKQEFRDNDLYGAIHRFQRARTIMKTLVSQLDILETMTPMSFASFRDRLEEASGFQSVQFREMEFLLGYKRAKTLEFVPPQSPARAVLKKRLKEPTVVDCFYEFLAHHGVTIPEELKNRDLTQPTEPNEIIQQGISRLYREKPQLAILFEQMVDYDEGQQEWRYRHVKMVERTIGNKQGTGGSLGVAFLKQSLFKSIFPDLWAVRHEF